ncbi:hypothetical protein [Paenibacillus sp. NAIST15-1]|uniref:hypothetical protein n=1 Tax=Paenibacillus sp. NAIST15-1 TaxID=1605994 RepID=UPI00086EBB81|nr:hypothetical protein [Paenibacillus sp. NAIST15-1]GAV12312.1 hypothetical protein PBN151_2245 [Paenibacillus sp. NAIST15-1]
MTRFMKQLIGIVVLLTLGVFIGMEITTSGIERIYGPINPSRITSAPESTERYSRANSNRDNLPTDNRRMNEDAAAQDNSRLTVNESTPIEEYRNTSADTERNTANNHENDINNTNVAPLPPVKDATVNQLADKTAGMLQRASQAGIQAVVGLFNGLF